MTHRARHGQSISVAFLLHMIRTCDTFVCCSILLSTSRVGTTIISTDVQTLAHYFWLWVTTSATCPSNMCIILVYANPNTLDNTVAPMLFKIAYGRCGTPKTRTARHRRHRCVGITRGFRCDFPNDNRQRRQCAKKHTTTEQLLPF